MAHDDLKCHQEYAPLIESWRRFKEKGLLSDEWSDFREYFGWAMANGYQPGTKVMRKDKKLPASPGNCYLILPAGIGNAFIKGGYKNRPCNGCYHDKPSGCVCYQERRRYKVWLDKCFEDAREAARRKGLM